MNHTFYKGNYIEAIPHGRFISFPLNLIVWNDASTELSQKMKVIGYSNNTGKWIIETNDEVKLFDHAANIPVDSVDNNLNYINYKIQEWNKKKRATDSYYEENQFSNMIEKFSSIKKNIEEYDRLKNLNLFYEMDKIELEIAETSTSINDFNEKLKANETYKKNLMILKYEQKTKELNQFVSSIIRQNRIIQFYKKQFGEILLND